MPKFNLRLKKTKSIINKAYKAKYMAHRYTQVKSVPTFLLGLLVFVGVNLVGMLQADSFY